MTDDDFRKLCNVYGFAPSRALRELIDCAVAQSTTHLMADAERYRYLRNRNPPEILQVFGRSAGVWIDCEDEDGVLVLLTGEDADDAIDAETKSKRVRSKKALTPSRRQRRTHDRPRASRTRCEGG